MNTLDSFASAVALSWLDMAALMWFAFCWLGYIRYTNYTDTQHPTLRSEMGKFTRQWMVRMVERDNRMMDVNIIRNLSRAAQFFASTTLLVLGALVAMMGYAEKAAGVLAELPFAQQVPERVWEMKILLLIFIFLYAFFKLILAIRQFGVCTVLVGATKVVPDDAELYAPHIDRIATIVSFANRNFNTGLRGYYFGVAALSWFLHPVLMVVVTIGVVYILYQRDFRSKTLQLLAEE